MDETEGFGQCGVAKVGVVKIITNNSLRVV